MVWAQEWLNKNYLQEQRKNIRELNISGWDDENEQKRTDWENLTGSLDLSDFVNLELLNCSFNNLTNLIINNCDKLEEILCSNNNLTTLTIDNQQLLEKLHCSQNNLVFLLVTNNPKLKDLDCSECSLTMLTLINNPLLEELECFENQLIDLNFLTTCGNENSLIWLSVSSNNLTSDLQALSKFIKLERLTLSNNGLAGSLQPLPHLTNLQVLKYWTY